MKMNCNLHTDNYRCDLCDLSAAEKRGKAAKKASIIHMLETQEFEPTGDVVENIIGAIFHDDDEAK